MKKIIALTLALLMLALMLPGCAKTGKDSDAAPQDQTDIADSFKTIGDMLALGCENEQRSTYEDMAVYVCEYEGTYYRAKAGLSQEISDELFDLDFFAEDYDEKYNEIISALEIDELEVLNDQILTREEMDALVGKTGQDLFDDGWYDQGYNLETMEFWLNYGPFLYTVVFDGKVDEANYDSFDIFEDAADLIVKSVEFLELGNATDIEID